MSKSRFRIGQWVRVVGPNLVSIEVGSVGKVIATRGRGYMAYVLFDDELSYGLLAASLKLLKGREKAIALAAKALGVKP